MDTFVEQIIKKKKEPLEIIIMVAVALAALTVSLAIFRFLPILSPSIVLILWGGWWLITNQNKEFEYSYTNGELDIDCIIAQRRRKRVASVTCAKVESYGRFQPEKMAGRKFDCTVMAAPELRMEGNYYFTYRSKKNGHTLVVFHPDERVQQAVYSALPRLMQIELDKENRNY